MNFFAYIALITLIAYTSAIYSKKNVYYGLNGSAYNNMTGALIAIAPTPYTLLYTYNEAHSLAQNCNITAIRTCQVLYQDMRAKYNAGDNTCSNYNSVTTLWSFLGSPNTTGMVDTLYTQTQSSSLNCATPEQYGRYLFSKALPQNFVSGKNVNYNLNNLQTNVVEPCGFSEIFE